MRVRLATSSDSEALFSYLQKLSDSTRLRFAPHSFDLETANRICAGTYNGCLAFFCFDGPEMVGYTVVWPGYLEKDRMRFARYLPHLEAGGVYTLAPSVADSYQSKGVGSGLMRFIEADLYNRGGRKIVLWGGVQQTNEKAVGFYLKHGYRIMGSFERNGSNLDMEKPLTGP